MCDTPLILFIFLYQNEHETYKKHQINKLFLKISTCHHVFNMNNYYMPIVWKSLAIFKRPSLSTNFDAQNTKQTWLDIEKGWLDTKQGWSNTKKGLYKPSLPPQL
jgi:hypothetical protein